MRSDTGTGVTIGVVGPRDLVEQMILLGRDLVGADDLPSWRLVGCAVGDEREIPERVARLQRSVDVVLLMGPLLHDIVREAGILEVPATHVSLSGAALYAAMLRRLLAGPVDLARASVDSLSEAETVEAYEQVGLPTGGVHVMAYDGPRSALAFGDFHLRLHQEGRTSIAFTTVRSIADRLATEGVPAARVMPPAGSLRMALTNAVLIGQGSQLEDASIAVGIVTAGEHRNGRQAHRIDPELRLALHQTLLREARRMRATVLPRDESSYLMVLTLGSLEVATDGFHVAPLLGAVEEAMGLRLTIGIGLGNAAADAEARAEQALVSSASGSCSVRWDDSRSISLPARERGPRRTEFAPPRTLPVLEHLTRGLTEMGSTSMVVDSDSAAEILGVSTRTARRLLRQLADDGLAWSMPATSGSKGGRPRYSYRLVQEPATVSTGTSRSRVGPS
jgi:hypothetical protein